MSLSYLQPVDEAFTLDDYKPQQVGFQLHKHLPSLGLPDLTDVKIAFFCIETEGQSFYRFRQHLYSLFMGNWNFAIADLGNLPLGETDDDTHFAIKEIVAELIKQDVIPVVLGGSQDFTYSLYRAFDSLEQMVNVVCVDAKFDFGDTEELFVESSYMSKLISEPPVNILDYTKHGYQTYYVAQ